MTTTDASTERARARIGTVVDGKWHLDALLGVGGMAAVYAATHRNRTRAAIKILNPDIALNPDAKSRFMREGYVANNIGHPRVVLVQDDDEAPDGTVYLVMELLEGQTLQSVLAEGKTLSVREVLPIALDVLDVLELAHEKGIVHRDLKPANLILSPDGRVKVLDFGVAKVRESTVTGVPNVTTLSPMGTPGFMAPEQARGRWDSVDGRADLWALGATMFALLTRRYVHEEETPNEQFLAAMTKPAPAIREVLPDLDPFVADIVDRALAFDRDERFRDAAEMKVAVTKAQAACEPDAVPVEPGTPSAPPKSTKSPITGGASVADVAPPGPAKPRRSLVLIGLALGATVLVVGVVRSQRAEVLAPSVDLGGRTSATIAADVVAPEPPPVLIAMSAPPAPTAADASSGPPTIERVPAARDRKPDDAKPGSPPRTKVVALPRGTPAAPPSAETTSPPSATVDIFGRRR